MLILKLLIATAAFADTSTTQTFSIVDGVANVTGKPSYSPKQARENWDAACEQWKSETKELNKSDQLMMMSCEAPSCSSDDGEIVCASNAVFKVKTAGTYTANPIPAAMPARATPVSEEIHETVVETPPPQVIYETVPAPRPGFIWIGGYWGWRSHRHFWIPGRWEGRRPGFVYVEPRWTAHGSRWRLEEGHWRH